MTGRRRTGEWVMDTVETGFTTSQVCRLAGVTARQLDYWTRTDLVSAALAQAHGSGTQRRWSREDVAFIRLVRELLALGVDLNYVRTIARPLRLSVDTRKTKPILVLTPSKATTCDVDDALLLILNTPSAVVLNVSEICALDDTGRDPKPAATGSGRTTSTGVNSRAAAVGL